MKVPEHRVIVIILLTLLMIAAADQSTANVREYIGMCDASASLAVDQQHFIMANDEDNILRIYHVDKSEPLVQANLSNFFGILYDDKSPESDIEGAAKIGDTCFFITSHGRDRKGRLRRNRHQFFAVKVEPGSNKVTPVGRSYQNLMDDLIHVASLKKIRLVDAYRPDNKKDDALAPKERGVNIEGLAATPTGTLLIGFRNPIPDGNALIVELLNPFEVVSGQLPEIGETFLLNLGGRGVRSMEYDPEAKNFIIVGGSRNGGMEARLYRWDGQSDTVDIQSLNFDHLKKFNPEAMHFTSTNMLHMSSDDGTVSAVDETGKKCECKELSNPHDKKYRSVWIETALMRLQH